MKIPAAARDVLLNPINDISRHIHPIFDIDVCPRKPIQNPREPEQQRGARAPRPSHDPMRAIKDSRAWRMVNDE